MQKLNTPLLPFPIYALVFDKDQVPEAIQYALMERGYHPTPIGDVALDEAQESDHDSKTIRILLIRKEHTACFGRARKHSLKARFNLIKLQNEEFILFEDFIEFLGTMRLEPGTIGARMQRRFYAPLYATAHFQAFQLPDLDKPGILEVFLPDPILCGDMLKIPRPPAYVTSHHHKELPGVFTKQVQKLLHEGAGFSPTPIQEPDIACGGVGLAKDYSNCKTEHELLNPTEDDLKPSVVNAPRPQPEVIPASKKKPGKPGNFVIPQDKTGAHPFAASDRDRVHRMDRDTSYLMLWGSAGMPSEPMKTLDEGKKLIEIGLAMALEEALFQGLTTTDEVRELKIPVIAVARDGCSIFEWDWKAEKFEPTDKWGPFELIPASE